MDNSTLQKLIGTEHIKFGDWDNRINNIYDIIVLLAKYKKYDSIDMLLDIINPKRISLDDLLSILTATAWYKDYLYNRSKFVRRASRRFDIIFRPRLLDGLR